MNPTSVERRFSLDSNILVYAADQDADANRHEISLALMAAGREVGLCPDPAVSHRVLLRNHAQTSAEARRRECFRQRLA